MKFLSNLIRLAKLAFGKSTGRETLVVIFLSLLMVLRTMLSIYISEINGQIIQSIVKQRLFDFIGNV